MPRTLGAGETVEIEVDYGAIVQAIIPPVANTDYFVRSAPDGDTAGSDKTGSITFTFADFGRGAKLKFVNAGSDAFYLTNLKIRGTPCRPASDHPLEIYEPSGAPAFPSKLRFTYALQSNRARAVTWAEYLGDRYVTQRERLPVTIYSTKNATLTTQGTTRVIADRVTITNDNKAYSTKINGDFYIDSISQQFGAGATSLITEWSLVPADANYAIFDTDSWDDAAAPWAP